MCADGDLIGHAARHHIDGGLLAEQSSRPLFEQAHGMVVAYTSSPAGASAIARRIASVGRLQVSLRRSIMRNDLHFELQRMLLRFLSQRLRLPRANLD